MYFNLLNGVSMKEEKVGRLDYLSLGGSLKVLGQVVGFVVTGESYIMLALRSISVGKFVVDEHSNIVTISNCMRLSEIHSVYVWLVYKYILFVLTIHIR